MAFDCLLPLSVRRVTVILTNKYSGYYEQQSDFLLVDHLLWK